MIRTVGVLGAGQMGNGIAHVFAQFGHEVVLYDIAGPLFFGAAQKAPAANIYLSPEQLMGREATAQSDIFSLGLIFYEFVTGVHPFHDADCSKTLDSIMHRPQFPTALAASQAPRKSTMQMCHLPEEQ